MHGWVPFSWTQTTFTVKSGAIWNFSKERGSTELISLWGTKGPFIRPRCIGTVRARTQMSINQSTNQSVNQQWIHLH